MGGKLAGPGAEGRAGEHSQIHHSAQPVGGRGRWLTAVLTAGQQLFWLGPLLAQSQHPLDSPQAPVYPSPIYLCPPHLPQAA